jgi:glycosyltransferase involved in cell wall biosynthesis
MCADRADVIPDAAARPLRIGIDAHAIGERKTGNERFIANLIPALRDRTDAELVLYFTHEPAARAWADRGMPNTTVRVLRPAHRLVRIPAMLPLRTILDRLDVLFVQYSGPPLAACPIVTVVHDIAFREHPEWFSRGERIWMGRTIPWTMRRAAAIVTVSRFSRDRIVAELGIRPEDIVVALEAADPVFFAASRAPASIDPPFFLAIGNLQPRKNLPTLIDAYRALLASRPDVRERLVIVGQPWLRAGEIQARAADLVAAGRIVFTGYLRDEEIASLLGAATAFAFPSLYEGFGLPVVEAMAAGAPVVVADTPVMREVGGDAAMRVPPTSVPAWTDALDRLRSDAGLRTRLVRRGAERAASLDWGATAERVLEALERAVARPNPRTTR